MQLITVIPGVVFSSDALAALSSAFSPAPARVERECGDASRSAPSNPAQIATPDDAGVQSDLF